MNTETISKKVLKVKLFEIEHFVLKGHKESSIEYLLEKEYIYPLFEEIKDEYKKYCLEKLKELNEKEEYSLIQEKKQKKEMKLLKKLFNEEFFDKKLETNLLKMFESFKELSLMDLHIISKDCIILNNESVCSSFTKKNNIQLDDNRKEYMRIIFYKEKIYVLLRCEFISLNNSGEKEKKYLFTYNSFKDIQSALVQIHANYDYFFN